MKHGVSRDLFGYWNAMRSTRSAPERGDIDPAAIRHILAYTFILEVEAGLAPGVHDVTFRLAGTRLNAVFQRDLRGTDFAHLWRPSETSLARTVLNFVLDDRAAIVVGAMGAPRGYDEVAFEMMLLPLRHHGKTHARLLGSLAAMVAPSWIGLYPVEHLELHSFRHVTPEPASVGTLGRDPRSEPLPLRSPVKPAATTTPGITRVGPFTVYEGGQPRPR